MPVTIRPDGSQNQIDGAALAKIISRGVSLDDAILIAATLVDEDRLTIRELIDSEDAGIIADSLSVFDLIGRTGV